MDLLLPCNSCTWINQQSVLLRRNSSFALTVHSAYPNSLICRRKTTSSELQTPVGVKGSSVNYSSSASVPTHKVTVHDRQRGVVHEFFVPEDQYILHTAESQNVSLPFACRHGCCTSCAVRVKSGQIRQPEALGISAELKSKACIFSPQSGFLDEIYFILAWSTRRPHIKVTLESYLVPAVAIYFSICH